MKKILMVVTFLLMVAMVPVAHASTYKLNAYDIWIDTGIVLNGESITFSNAQTHSNVSGHENQWTWGIGHYFITEGIPYVWTNADGGYGPWSKVGDGIVTDAWYKEAKNGIEANHGMLIGYIGYENPLSYAGYYPTTAASGTGPVDATDLAFLSNVFGIGTATVTQFGSGNVWIGFNDGFYNYPDAWPDDSGWVEVQIPEPASMLLLFFGLMGVLGLRRKFKS